MGFVVEHGSKAGDIGAALGEAVAGAAEGFERKQILDQRTRALDQRDVAEARYAEMQGGRRLKASNELLMIGRRDARFERGLGILGQDQEDPETGEVSPAYWSEDEAKMHVDRYGDDPEGAMKLMDEALGLKFMDDTARTERMAILPEAQELAITADWDDDVPASGTGPGPMQRKFNEVMLELMDEDVRDDGGDPRKYKQLLAQAQMLADPNGRKVLAKVQLEAAETALAAAFGGLSGRMTGAGGAAPEAAPAPAEDVAEDPQAKTDPAGAAVRFIGEIPAETPAPQKNKLIRKWMKVNLGRVLSVAEFEAMLAKRELSMQQHAEVNTAEGTVGQGVRNPALGGTPQGEAPKPKKSKRKASELDPKNPAHRKK